MPNEMLRVAIEAAYGEEAVGAYSFQKKMRCCKGLEQIES